MNRPIEKNRRMEINDHLNCYYNGTDWARPLSSDNYVSEHEAIKNELFNAGFINHDERSRLILIYKPRSRDWSKWIVRFAQVPVCKINFNHC